MFLIMDYNRVLAHSPINEFMTNFKQFSFKIGSTDIDLSKEEFVVNLEKVKNDVELYTYESEEFVLDFLKKNNIPFEQFKVVPMALEDAFIGLTGKY